MLCGIYFRQKPKKPLLVSKAQAVSASNQISKSPNISASSTPSSAKMPYVSVSKLNSGNNVVKTTSININSDKLAINSLSTPTAAPKKVVPTILDYANSNTGSACVMSDGSLMRSSSHGGVDLTSPTVIKVSDMKLSGAGSKQMDSSWDHMVSDILRSSIGGEQPTRKSPPKPVIHRQNSNVSPVASTQAASGFMAQFAKYVSTQDTLNQKQLSPNQKVTDTQLMLSEQHNKLLQQQKIQQQIEAEKQRQLRLLKAQQKELEEKQKQFHTQQVAKQLASAQKAALGQKLLTKSDDQPKMPAPSPMSLSMAKNIPASQGGPRKQLTDQFKDGSSQQKHLSDNLIRQQLNDSNQGRPQIHQVKVNKNIQNQLAGHYVQVSSVSDTLRKSSPQSQTVKVTHNSQGKTASPHVVTIHSSQNQAKVLFSPAGVTTSTNSRPATSLLKTLFGQAQAQTSSPSFPGQVIQRSPNQGSPNPRGNSPLTQAQHQWNPSSSLQELQARLQSAAGMQAKPYSMPVTSAQPGPGYQSVKLSSLTPEQIQSFQTGNKKIKI